MENLVIRIQDLPTVESAFKSFKEAVGKIVEQHNGYPVELNKACSELYVRAPAKDLETIKREVKNFRL